MKPDNLTILRLAEAAVNPALPVSTRLFAVSLLREWVALLSAQLE